MYQSGDSERESTKSDIYKHKEKTLRLTYEQFLMKGVLNIAIRDVLMIILILTIGAIGTVLIAYTNYGYLYRGAAGPLFTRSRWHAGAQSALLVILWGALVPYTLFLVARLCVDLKRHIPIKRFLARIGVQQGDLETIEWQDVIQRVRDDFAGHYKDRRATIDELYIMNIIMRDENYLIGLTCAGLLDLSVGLPRLLGGRRLFATDFMYTLLRLTVLRVNYSEEGVRSLIVDRAKWERDLRWRFVLLGVATAVFMPAIFVVLLLYFVTRYGTQAYSDSGSVTKGKWTAHARWSLRHFNEAEHFFTNRLKRGYDSAAAYADLFPLSSHVTWAARYLAYIVGFVLAVMIVFTATSPLFVFEVFGVSSVSIVSVLTVAFGILLSIGPKETLEDDFGGKLAALCTYTEHSPRMWKDRPRSPDTYEEFSAFFKPRALTWLDEVLSIVFAPYILIAKLPNRAGDIVDFMRDNTYEELRVCSFAMLGTAKNESENNGNGKRKGKGDDASSLSSSLSSSSDGYDLGKDEKEEDMGDGNNDNDDVNNDSGDGEFERPTENIVEVQEKKSLLCFMRDYPEWRKPKCAVRFVRTLSNYLKEKKKTEDKEVITKTMILDTSSAYFDAHYAQRHGSSSSSSSSSSDVEDAESFISNSIYASTVYDNYNEDRKQQQ